MGSVFIYIIKFIIEINTAIKIAPALAPLVFLSASVRGSAASILGPLGLFTSAHSSANWPTYIHEIYYENQFSSTYKTD